MEIRLRARHWEHRMADWPAAAIAGFAAGAVLMVLELCWTALAPGEGPWMTFRSVAAILLGHEVLASSTFSIGVAAAALATHYGLGILFGVVLGMLLARFPADWGWAEALVCGALFGGALYLLNYYVFVSIFPWMVKLRGWPAVVGHLAFGVSAALLYWKLERRGVREA